MPWYKRLRWRLLAAQFLVALVGVAVMLLATWGITRYAAADIIHVLLLPLGPDQAQLAAAEAALVAAFRQAVGWSVAVAALAAITAGVASSLLLWRTLIMPLRQMANSSRRIADGRYDERVTIPTNSGEAMAQLVHNFNEMAASLAQVEQQRVALLANISHELRTPLTGLKGYLEGLQDGLFAANEETFGWMLQEIDRMGRLVEDIHQLSRVEAGQITLQLRPFDLAELARQVQTSLLPAAQAGQITLAVAAPDTAVTVYADPDRVTQVLLNLVSNALRYTPPHGRVTLHLHRLPHQAQLDVTDTGVGIPAEALPYVFERFYRVDPSRARTSGGSGIGLTIARHLIWAMGGELTAVSPGPGSGSTFSFTLPPGD
ncbi:MAG: HAMP domain-containing protein [Ardenticatenaceae bacterium]|nr:HAMP domain-containing protein [Ardenticatenaceae bacterium]